MRTLRVIMAVVTGAAGLALLVRLAPASPARADAAARRAAAEVLGAALAAPPLGAPGAIEAVWWPAWERAAKATGTTSPRVLQGLWRRQAAADRERQLEEAAAMAAMVEAQGQEAAALVTRFEAEAAVRRQEAEVAAAHRRSLEEGERAAAERGKLVDALERREEKRRRAEAPPPPPERVIPGKGEEPEDPPPARRRWYLDWID